jgi:Cu(I)/Ag(I) efflux system membrane fusion protein
MHPDVIQDEAGHCPICEMTLERLPELAPVVTNVPKTDKGGDALVAVRKGAVLDTGRRQVVYRKGQDGAFELVEVKLGPLAESKADDDTTALYYPVIEGLSPGDEVVIQGGFLLDSQRQLEGMPSLLYEEGRSAASLHAGHGGEPPVPAKTPTKPPAMPGGHKHPEPQR